MARLFNHLSAESITTMKSIITAVFVAIILWSWALCSHAQTVEVYNQFGKQSDETWKNKAVQIRLYDSIRYGWLIIGRYDYTPQNVQAWDAKYTYMASRFKPYITEYPNHLYIITFVNEMNSGF